MNIVIIEDEPLLAQALEAELREVDPFSTVTCKLTTIEEALAYLTPDTMPDLFFSDIQLPDGLSFEIFKTLGVQVPVVFCTAFDSYALEAFKANGIDYILKPFATEDIRATIIKYKQLVSGKEEVMPDLSKLVQWMEHNRREEETQTSILVHQGEKITPVKSSEVALASLDHGLVSVFTFTGQRFPVNYNMDKLHQHLGKGFYRVNRQYVINRDAVQHVSRYFARKLLIQPSISFSEPLIVSKAGASDFLRWLETTE